MTMEMYGTVSHTNIISHTGLVITKGQKTFVSMPIYKARSTYALVHDYWEYLQKEQKNRKKKSSIKA